MFDVAGDGNALFLGCPVEIELGLCAGDIPAAHGAADHGFQLRRCDPHAAVGEVRNVFVFLPTVCVPLAAVVPTLASLNHNQFPGAGQDRTALFR